MIGIRGRTKLNEFFVILKNLSHSCG